jgi:ABC-type multidrug transport system fused ATPase/permease subunit
MAAVSQEVVLFSTTIRQNIMYGNPNATESDMEEAAKLANVDRIVEKFPQVNMVTNVFYLCENNIFYEEELPGFIF